MLLVVGTAYGFPCTKLNITIISIFRLYTILVYIVYRLVLNGILYNIYYIRGRSDVPIYVCRVTLMNVEESEG